MSGPRSLTLTGADGRTMTVDLFAYLDAEAAEQAANESNQWIKSLRTAAVGEVAFRDRFTYRGDSLWWFAEIFLHRQGVIADLWRVALALDALCARERPSRIEHVAGDRLLDLLVPQVAARHGVAHHARRAHHAAAGSSGAPRVSDASGAAAGVGVGAGVGAGIRTSLKSHLYTWTALASRLRPRSAAAREGDEAAGGGTLVFVHSAFVHGSGEEGYIGAILRELQQRLEARPVRLVGVGPRTNFKARRWWHPLVPGRGRGRLRGAAPDAASAIVPVEALASWQQLAGSRGIWRERRAIERALLASDALRQRARLRGYDIWPIISDELRGVARLQFTWSARAMDEAAAAMERYRPARVVTYAEAGGWGRAIMIEARRRGIPSVGLQHGFIYRHWLNYLHAPDEMQPSAVNPGDRGFPRPDRTLLYDGYAARHLRAEGHFPPDALIVSGSPGLDALIAAVGRLTDEDRARIRATLGLAEGEALGVIVSKHTQIREALPALARAAAARPGLRVVIKPHPAEVADLYVKTLAETATSAPAVPGPGASGPGASRPAVSGPAVSGSAAPGPAAPGSAGARPVGARPALGAANPSSPGGARITIAPASLDLASLLAVAQVVITVNSTVAIDAMSLSLPSLIVLLPNNLSPFVSAGAMAGAPDLGRLPEALARVLDETERMAILTRARQFLRDSAAGDAISAGDRRSDGGAAARAADAVLAARAADGAGPAAL